MLTTLFPSQTERSGNLGNFYLMSKCTVPESVCQGNAKFSNYQMYIAKKSFNILYKTYIRPHNEYCIQAWSPYYAKDIDMLKKIQYRATKLIPQLANLPYEERSQNLNMYSLYCRHEPGDLIETFKIFKQL